MIHVTYQHSLKIIKRIVQSKGGVILYRYFDNLFIAELKRYTKGTDNEVDNLCTMLTREAIASGQLKSVKVTDGTGKVSLMYVLPGTTITVGE